MITLFAAAALAAQPAAVPASQPPQQAPMMEMGEMHGKDGGKADLKDCCCKDMAKHDGHAEAASSNEERGR